MCCRPIIPAGPIFIRWATRESAVPNTLVGIRLYDREQHRQHRHLFGGHDPGVCACGNGANAAWLTGCTDEAMQLAEQAIALGAEIDHPFSQSIALVWTMVAAFGMRDYALRAHGAENLLQISERHGFPEWRGASMVVSGACQALAGETEFGLKLAGKGLLEHRRTGGGGSLLAFVFATSAAAQMQSGNLRHAQELLAEAICACRKDKCQGTAARDRTSARGSAPHRQADWYG